jgi:hypothetical protein
MANLDSLTLEDLLSKLVEALDRDKELLTAPCQLLLVGIDISFFFASQHLLIKEGLSEAKLLDWYEANVVFFDCSYSVLREFERINSSLPIIMAIEPSPWPDEITHYKELELREVLYVKQHLERLLDRHVYTIALLTGIVTDKDRLDAEDALGIPCELVDLLKVILRVVQAHLAIQADV